MFPRRVHTASAGDGEAGQQPGRFAGEYPRPPSHPQTIPAGGCSAGAGLPTHSYPSCRARNVLLTSSLVAKISDLGNAWFVNLQPGQLARTLTSLLGTMTYMPPEAFDEHSQYGPRLDIFAFGHLTLFTLTQVREGWINSTVCMCRSTVGVLFVHGIVSDRAESFYWGGGGGGGGGGGDFVIVIILDAVGYFQVNSYIIECTYFS